MRKDLIIYSLILGSLVTVLSFFVMRELHYAYPPKGADYIYGFGFPLKYYFSGGLAGETDQYPPMFLADVAIWSVVAYLVLTKIVKAKSK